MKQDALIEALLDCTMPELQAVLWEVQQRSHTNLGVGDPAAIRGGPAYGGPPLTLRQIGRGETRFGGPIGRWSYEVCLWAVGSERAAVAQALRKAYRELTHDDMAMDVVARMLREAAAGRRVLVIELRSLSQAQEFRQTLVHAGADVRIEQKWLST